MSDKKQVSNIYSGVVWIVSSLTLTSYGILTLTNQNIPGVEELVRYLSSVDNTHIYLAAFLSIFIEGLYLIGSFFPGSSLVVILSIISQTGGAKTFLTTICVIFFGWCLAGGVNIVIAKLYGARILKQSEDSDYEVKDKILITWFPAFRANYEVAQIIAGGNPYKVFWSSVKVKFLVSICMLGCMSLVPFLVDINQVSNKDGALSIFVIAGISLIVGIIKIRNYLR